MESKPTTSKKKTQQAPASATKKGAQILNQSPPDKQLHKLNLNFQENSDPNLFPTQMGVNTGGLEKTYEKGSEKTHTMDDSASFDPMNMIHNEDSRSKNMFENTEDMPLPIIQNENDNMDEAAFQNPHIASNYGSGEEHKVGTKGQSQRQPMSSLDDSGEWSRLENKFDQYAKYEGIGGYNSSGMPQMQMMPQIQGSDQEQVNFQFIQSMQNQSNSNLNPYNGSGGATPHKFSIPQARRQNEEEKPREVTSDELKNFLRSKEDLIRQLRYTKQMYLPDTRFVTIDFLAGVFSGSKKLIPMDRVKFAFSVKNLLKNVVGENEYIRRHLPDYNLQEMTSEIGGDGNYTLVDSKKSQVPRDFLIAVLNTLKPGYFQTNFEAIMEQTRLEKLKKESANQKQILLTEEYYDLLHSVPLLPMKHPNKKSIANKFSCAPKKSQPMLNPKKRKISQISNSMPVQWENYDPKFGTQPKKRKL